MGVHEDIADQRAFDEQASGADQHQFANLFRVADGELGGDPAADAAADEIEARELQDIEHFEIMKNHVFDGVDILVFIGQSAAGMSRRDDPRALG